MNKTEASEIVAWFEVGKYKEALFECAKAKGEDIRFVVTCEKYAEKSLLEKMSKEKREELEKAKEVFYNND